MPLGILLWQRVGKKWWNSPRARLRKPDTHSDYVPLEGPRFVAERLEPRTLLASAITGMVFNDLDGDGVHDAGEVGLAEWRVGLDTNGDGAYEVINRTDEHGNYAFTNLRPGQYVVGEVRQVGLRHVTGGFVAAWLRCASFGPEFSPGGLPPFRAVGKGCNSQSSPA